MADPWADFRAAAPPISQPDDPWAAFRAPAPEKPVVSGKILPFSKGKDGTVSFDSNAGIVGVFKRAFNLPGEVMRGEVDPKSDEGIGRAMEMATAVSPVTPALRAGGIPGLLPMREAKVAPPGTEALRTAAETGYENARGMGVEYSSSAVKQLAKEARLALEKDGILANLAPKSFKILDDLSRPPAGSAAPLTGLEAARRAFGHAAKDFQNPTEQLAAQRIIKSLDDFMEAADPKSVVAGPAAAASQVLQDARGNYAAAMRSDKVTGAGEAAELSAAVANSGANVDNAIRQRIKSLLLSPKQSAGFSQAERDALESVAAGTTTRNTIRTIGNLLGGGGGLGATVTALGAVGATGMAGTPAGLATGVGIPLLGYAAKTAGNKITQGALRTADELIRSRSPLHQSAPPGQMQSGSPEGYAAIVRLLMGEPQAAQRR